LSHMADYGSGIAFDGNFDWSVDSTGDLAFASELDELKKDLAFRVASALMYGERIERPESIAGNGVIGEPLTDGLLADIEIAVAKVVSDDARIDSVAVVEAEQPDTSSDFVEIRCETIVDTESESFQFIIPSDISIEEFRALLLSGDI
jgi:hypothetical protein